MQREKSSAMQQNWNVLVKYLPVAEDPGPWMLKSGLARSRQEIWESTGRSVWCAVCNKMSMLRYFKRTSQNMEMKRTSENFERTSENFERTSENFERTFEDFERTSENFKRTFEDFERTSENFERTFEDSNVRLRISNLRSRIQTYV